MTDTDWFFKVFGSIGDRGGAGRNGDGTFPPTDGRGCPLCGAIGNGGHGAGCLNFMYRYNEDGEPGGPGWGALTFWKFSAVPVSFRYFSEVCGASGGWRQA